MCRLSSCVQVSANVRASCEVRRLNKMRLNSFQLLPSSLHLPDSHWGAICMHPACLARITDLNRRPLESWRKCYVSVRFKEDINCKPLSTQLHVSIFKGKRKRWGKGLCLLVKVSFRILQTFAVPSGPHRKVL